MAASQVKMQISLCWICICLLYKPQSNAITQSRKMLQMTGRVVCRIMKQLMHHLLLCGASMLMEEV